MSRSIRRSSLLLKMFGFISITVSHLHGRKMQYYGFPLLCLITRGARSPRDPLTAVSLWHQDTCISDMNPFEQVVPLIGVRCRINISTPNMWWFYDWKQLCTRFMINTLVLHNARFSLMSLSHKPILCMWTSPRWRPAAWPWRRGWTPASPSTAPPRPSPTRRSTRRPSCSRARRCRPTTCWRAPASSTSTHASSSRCPSAPSTWSTGSCISPRTPWRCPGEKTFVPAPFVRRCSVGVDLAWPQMYATVCIWIRLVIAHLSIQDMKTSLQHLLFNIYTFPWPQMDKEPNMVTSWILIFYQKTIFFVATNGHGTKYGNFADFDILLKNNICYLWLFTAWLSPNGSSGWMRSCSWAGDGRCVTRPPACRLRVVQRVWLPHSEPAGVLES